MFSYSLGKKWKYFTPVVSLIPEGILKFAALGFVKLQKRELIGDKLPKRIIFFVTNRCNLRCRHCFYIPYTTSASEMSLNQIEQLAASAGHHLRQVILTGGEPFLRNDFSDIVLSFVKNGCQIVNIDTNGTLIDRVRTFLERILSETKVKLVFQISLDGPAKIHDSIRNLEGASAKALETIALLSNYYRKYPSRFGTIVVVTSINRLNLKYLSGVIEQIKPFKNIINLFNFTRSANLHTFGLSRDELSGFDVQKDIILNLDEMKKAFSYLERKLWSKSNIPLLAILNRQIMIETIRLLEKKSVNSPCLAGRTEIIIYPEGEVGICEMLKPVGHLKETNYNLIKFYQQERDKFQALRKCFCTHDCSIMSLVRFSPDSLVEMIKKKKPDYENFK